MYDFTASTARAGATCNRGIGRRPNADLLPGILRRHHWCSLREDRKSPLFRTIARGTMRLSESPLPQASAFQMVRRRAAAADNAAAIGNHSFRATGIPAYLKTAARSKRLPL